MDEIKKICSTSAMQRCVAESRGSVVWRLVVILPVGLVMGSAVTELSISRQKVICTLATVQSGGAVPATSLSAENGRSVSLLEI